MFRLLRALRLFLGRLRLPKQVEWRRDDAAALGSFLRSPTGIRLIHLIHSRVVAACEYAADKGDQISCGQAQGIRAMNALFNSLATAHSGTSEQPADTDGTADPLAHLRP